MLVERGKLASHLHLVDIVELWPIYHIQFKLFAATDAINALYTRARAA